MLTPQVFGGTLILWGTTMKRSQVWEPSVKGEEVARQGGAVPEDAGLEAGNGDDTQTFQF